MCGCAGVCVYVCFSSFSQALVSRLVTDSSGQCFLVDVTGGVFADSGFLKRLVFLQCWWLTGIPKVEFLYLLWFPSGLLAGHVLLHFSATCKG